VLDRRQDSSSFFKCFRSLVQTITGRACVAVSSGPRAGPGKCYETGSPPMFPFPRRGPVSLYKSNNVSRFDIFKKFFEYVNSKISLTCCTCASKRVTRRTAIERIVNEVSLPTSPSDMTYTQFVTRNTNEISQVINNHQEHFG